MRDQLVVAAARTSSVLTVKTASTIEHPASAVALAAAVST
jgi:hypothetical protein